MEDERIEFIVMYCVFYIDGLNEWIAFYPICKSAGQIWSAGGREIFLITGGSDTPLTKFGEWRIMKRGVEEFPHISSSVSVSKIQMKIPSLPIQ